MDEWFYASATTLARSIQDRKVRSEEVVQLHLQRIESVNPRLNAVVQLAGDQAMEAAHAADKALASAQHVGALHGVPFTVKDWIDTAGLPCTAGDPAFSDRVPEKNATAVNRLLKAGAILLGKTNVMVDNPVYGRTNNPYNLDYGTTGSTSGEAALIASGGSPLGLGSDSGGSIRQPAHACGICGMKPTTGRIPLTGHFPFISTVKDTRTTLGPLARFVEDLALVLPILSGVDWWDASAVPVPLEDWRRVDVRTLRVAFYTNHAEADPTAETVESCHQAAKVLEATGAHVEELHPPRIEEAASITHQYWQRPGSTSPDEWHTQGSAELSSLELEQHLFAWDRFRRSLHAFMEHHDVILTPAAAKPATPHGQDDGGIPYTLPYSLTGWPCVVVRAGTDPAGLPIGVQLVARPWRDDVALAAAYEIERTLGGWSAPVLN